MAKKSAVRSAKSVEKLALSFRLPAPIRKALDEAAAADDRNVTSYVTRVISQHLREAGYLKGVAK